MDRVVLITGATGGLGRITARTFAEAGGRLVLTGTDEERLRALGAELELEDDVLCPSWSTCAIARRRRPR